LIATTMPHLATCSGSLFDSGISLFVKNLAQSCSLL
uniref:Secreted protein n=1 Tax=Echinostoma caproni TaxID=27848 RepID=A0A183BG05_9TREM